jgi:hypothetical protein
MSIVSKAHQFLVGDRESLYHAILTQVGALAALNFKAMIERIFAMARDREYK